MLYIGDVSETDFSPTLDGNRIDAEAGQTSPKPTQPKAKDAEAKPPNRYAGLTPMQRLFARSFTEKGIVASKLASAHQQSQPANPDPPAVTG